ncbi:MAG: helix-turn-helix transcriptional regulator [Kiritimatiellae bacterium]|nr:helix-turn-helix transcriptional regulator [Kiritimatiellia bacterium]
MSERLYPEIRLQILYCEMRRRFRWNDRPLAAPYWRFYWNENRAGRVAFEGRETELGPGMFVLIAPNTAYVGMSPEPMDHFYVHFVAESPYDVVQPMVFGCEATHRGVSAIGEVVAVLGSEAAFSPRVAVLVRGLLYDLLGRVPEERLGAWCREPRLRRVLGEIAPRLHQRITNTDLARKCGMNTNAFIRLFRRELGETPREYVVRKRIEKACVMLHFSDATVESVAAACGFCDRHYFSRVFKAYRGVGPAAFRTRRPA